MSDNVRAYVAALITPMLPTGWRIIPAQAPPSVIDRPTVIIKHSSIARLEESPTGHLRHSLTITLADPHSDQAAAEDALDGAVLDLVTAIDARDTLDWTAATKVQISDRYIGWDITATAITTNSHKE